MAHDVASPSDQRDVTRDASVDGSNAPTARTEFVDVAPGVQVFVRLAGLENQGEPLILLHGNRDNHTHYAELESILARTHQTVSLDFRGHGFSSKPDCVLTPEVFAADLDAVIRHYGWDRVVLIGHSLGSIVSMVYAFQHPERVARLILMGSAAYYKAAWKRPDIPLTEETFPQMIEEANKRAGPFFFMEQYPDVQRRAIAVWSLVPFHVHRNLLNLVHPDLRDQVPQLSMPTLVIAGEEDKSTTVEHARWIHEHLPNGQLAIIPQTAHFMYMEKPETVATRIEQFLTGDTTTR